MDQDAIVYFPKINSEKINRFREKYDPHGEIIAPHITLVSPFLGFTDLQIAGHLEIITRNIRPFPIHLQGLEKTNDNRLTLLVKEGREDLVKIHDLFYSGILASLVQPHVFDPHITLGEFGIKDNEKAYTEAEGFNLDLHTIFDGFTLIKGDGISAAKIVKTYDLK